MSTTIRISFVILGIYSLYFGYMGTRRGIEIRKRAERVLKAKESTDLESQELARPEDQFSTLVVAGRFVNPFPEYREQGIFEFIIWKIVELVRWSPRGGVPRNRRRLLELLHVYQPDFRILFEVDNRHVAVDDHTLLPLIGAGLEPAAAPGAGPVDVAAAAVAASAGTVLPVPAAAADPRPGDRGRGRAAAGGDSGPGLAPAAAGKSTADSWTAVELRAGPGAGPESPVMNSFSLDSPASSVADVADPDLRPLPVGTDPDASARPVPAAPPALPAAADRITITWIGQSCTFIQCGGINFLTDPIFGNHIINAYVGPQRLVRPPCRLEDLPPVDYVLVSHDHPDHLEDATIRQIGNRAFWVVPLGLKRFLARRGIFRVAELTWWARLHLPGTAFGHWEIACTPAMHWSGRKLFDSNHTLWCSFVVLCNGRPVFYHAGDTGYTPELFKGIGQVYGPGCRVAVVPCGSYSPRWHLRPQHCDPAEAIQIMQDIGATRLVGVHWGTFVLSNEHYMEPKHLLESEAAARGLTDAVWPAEFGRTIVIPLTDENSTSPDENSADNDVGPVPRMRPLEGRDAMLWA
ncbi:beta-lactamase superfamily domain-containing protein [Dipodascopsis tothii]|uniref:beta-lactamase superfamily domain-containing protein n=1 Tax=Dipodascopsis tothii TaxID=44089 RepID=UPI0034CF5EB2